MFDVFLVSAIIATEPAAQQARRPPAPQDDDAIVITGERIPRTLKETASSAVIIKADEIQAQPVDRVDQLLAAIPNVQIGSGTEAPAIRGNDTTGVVRELFSFLGGTRPRATLSVDGRAVTYSEYVNGVVSIWDVDQVEVFRSPQTTTQGRNAIGGAIFVTTADPTYNRQVTARALIGDAHTRQFSAALSGPVIADQLAIRLSGDVRLGRNSSRMADGIEGADISRDDHQLIRAKVLLEPRRLPGWRLEAIYVHTQSTAPQFESVRAPFERRRSPLFEPTNGVIEPNVDSLTVSLAYTKSNHFSARSTVSYGDALIRRFGLPGLGRTKNQSRDFSIENVGQWQTNANLRMTGGIHYFALRQRQTIDITGLRIGKGGFDDEQFSLGVFGELAWRATPRLEFVAGVRHQRDSQDRVGQVGDVGTGISVNYDRTFVALLPKFSVSYEISDAARVGFTVQRASNPGGTTVNLASRRQDDFDAERLWNYEAFLRLAFDGGRGFVAANLFQNDIEDAQRSLSVEVPVPGGPSLVTTQIANAPSARARGLELDVRWRPTDRLTLRAGVGWLDTKMTDTLVLSDPTRGKSFQRAPKVSVSAAVDWRPTDLLQLTAQLRSNSGYFSDDANTPDRRIEGFAVVNARASYRLGRVTAFGYVRNLFDNFYMTHLFNAGFGTAGDPREFGAGIETRF